MKSKSIRYYFFTSITTVLVASVLVMGMIQTYVATTYFRVEKEKLLWEVTEVIAESARQGKLDITTDSLLSLEYIAQISDSVIFITDLEGVVTVRVGETAPERGTQLSTDTLAKLQQNSEMRDSGTLDGLFGSDHYTSGMVMSDAAGAPVAYVFAASDAMSMRVYIMDTMSTFVMSAGLVLLVSSLLALALSNRTIIPIRRLADAAKRFGEGDYSARVPVEGDDELAQLAVTFNEMANSFEATDVSRRSFMGNIAHELRTPMTTIKGFIDGMLDGTIPVEQRDRYLTVVSDEVGRLARLTKNMLDVSRLEAGEYTPNTVTFDLWRTVTNVFLSAEQRLDDKSIQVVGLAHEYPAMVLGDEDFVHQVIFNLVDNAIKFAGEKGTITVRMELGKNMVTASIRNSGAGIPADTLPYVFDRFYKADKSRGVKARGAGLGLHISKVLVGLMGGRIWADSEEDEWTEFSFTLPAASMKKASKQRSTRQPRKGLEAKSDEDAQP